MSCSNKSTRPDSPAAPCGCEGLLGGARLQRVDQGLDETFSSSDMYLELPERRQSCCSSCAEDAEGWPQEEESPQRINEILDRGGAIVDGVVMEAAEAAAAMPQLFSPIRSEEASGLQTLEDLSMRIYGPPQAVSLPPGVEWTPGMIWGGKRVAPPDEGSAGASKRSLLPTDEPYGYDSPLENPPYTVPVEDLIVEGPETPSLCESALSGQITPGELFSLYGADAVVSYTDNTPAPTDPFTQSWSTGTLISIDIPTVYCRDGSGVVADFLEITSTPVIVGNWLVFAVHYKRPCPADEAPPYQDSLLGLYLPTATSGAPEIYVLSNDGGDTESTVLFDSDDCLIYWSHFVSNSPVVGGWPIVTVLDAIDFSLVAQHTGKDADGQLMYTGNDSSGVLTTEGYIFGTTNAPESACNNTGNGERTACGAVLVSQIDYASGTIPYDINIKGQVDYNKDNFRTWVGGSVSADSENTLFVGGSSQYASAWGRRFSYDRNTGAAKKIYIPYHNDVFETHGITNPFTGAPLTLFENRYGCSATKIEGTLTDIKVKVRPTLTPFDPEDIETCRVNPGDDFKSAVSGEVVVGDKNFVWAQFSSNNYYSNPGRRNTYQVYAINKSDMSQACEFVIKYASDDYKGTTFYQASTLASEELGFAVFNTSYTRPFPADAQLFGMVAIPMAASNFCEMFEYDRLEGELVHHSPTLVSGPDGEYVLLASDHYLSVFDQKMGASDPLLKIDLARGNPHTASPVIYNGSQGPILFLLSEKGDISILPTPLRGYRPATSTLSTIAFEDYGAALWPRFRADNCGSGRPDGPARCR